MRLMQLFCVGVTALLLSFSAIAATQDLAGVKVEDSVTIGGVKLPLNGAGVRSKATVKIYVASLYAQKKVTSLDDLLAASGPKRLMMIFLRETDSDTFAKLMMRGVENNTSKGDMTKLSPSFGRMSDIFSHNKSYLAGDVVAIDWIPGTGMVITGKGKQLGQPFTDPEFYKSMMAIWLGAQPADQSLKDALLGAAK